MRSINLVSSLKIIAIIVLAGLLSLSPNMNIIPKSLIVTSFYDSHRLIELVLILFALLHHIIAKNQALYFPANKTILFSLYLLTALMVGSSCLALSPRHALLEISLLAGLAYFSLLIASMYRDNGSLIIKQFTYIFWAGIVLSIVAFYVGYITATVFKTPVIWPGPISGFNNVRFFNQYQLWTLGFITLPLLNSNLNHIRRWLHLGLTLWWVLLFYSASRGALLAWCAGILITAVMYRKLAWPFIRLQLIYIATGFITYQILFQIIPYLRESAVVTGTIIRDTTNDRVELWIKSLDLIKSHPLFGVGPMHFAWYSPISAHPHNSVFQLMAEWGLPAALLIICLCGYGLLCWLKKLNRTASESENALNRNLVIVLFFTVVTNATYSLVDGVIVMPISQVMMFTMIGLMLGFYSNKNAIGVTKNPLLNKAFACIVLITLMWSVLPEILQSANGSEKRFSIGYLATGPRIWIELK